MSDYPKLAWSLAALIEEHGADAMFATLADACDVAADHIGGAKATRFTTVAHHLRMIQDTLAAASAPAGITLDQALAVLAEACE